MFLIALLTASRPLLLFTSFTYVLTSTAYLYMPQLFTHCLPTITCVTLNRCILWMYYKTIGLCFFKLYYYFPFMCYFCKYFLSPCFSLCTLFLCELCGWFLTLSHYLVWWLSVFVFHDPFRLSNIVYLLNTLRAGLRYIRTSISA